MKYSVELIYEAGQNTVGRYPWHHLAVIGDTLELFGPALQILTAQQMAYRMAKKRGWGIHTIRLKLTPPRLLIVRTH